MVVLAGLHLLVAGLLAVTVGSAVAGNADHPVAVLAGAALMAAVYAAGAAAPQLRRERRLAVAWLAAVLFAWVALLILTPDAVWLAFPLFFMDLHLLGQRWGLVALGSTTAIAVAGFAWHQHTITLAAVIGPVIGAGVAVAVGYQVLYRESEHRQRLLDQLTAAQADLAAAERAAGTAALLRIAQSALANTVQHAHASQATVTLSYTDARVMLEVADDGTGFNPGADPAEGTGPGDASPGSAAGGGFGIAAMRARTRALGGTMTVESAPGQGAVLAASFPAGTAGETGPGEPGGPVTASR